MNQYPKVNRLSDKEFIKQSFIQNAQATGATVTTIPHSSQAIAQTLHNLTEGSKILLYSPPSFLSADLFEDFLQSADVITDPDKEQLEQSTIGITDSFAGIARTGSVCLELNNGMGNHVSLLSRQHIAILDEDRIVPRPRDVFSNGFLLKEGKPRDFVIITGPSATADMGKLVRGAHGPEKLHIIILEK